MKMLGNVFFADRKLNEFLEQSFIRNAQQCALELPVEITKRELRSEIKAATYYGDVPELGEPDQVKFGAPDENNEIIASCTISFTGDAALFQCSAPIWPVVRTVRGKLRNQRLVLEVQVWRHNARWAGALLAAELGEMQRNLDAQHQLVYEYNSSLGKYARELVDDDYMARQRRAAAQGAQNAEIALGLLKLHPDLTAFENLPLSIDFSMPKLDLSDLLKSDFTLDPDKKPAPKKSRRKAEKHD